MERRIYRIIVLMVCILAMNPNAFAGWAVNGDAFVTGNQVTLTPELNDQAGSAWIETRIDLSNDFDISFKINLGSNDGGGADGISFALHNDATGTTAFGDTSGGGEWIGMNGICPSVSVEVDTWQNAARGDPAADHVGVNVYTGTSGACTGVPDHAGAGPVQASATSANVEDGAEHDFRITWDVSSQTMTVYFDGSQRLTYTNDLINNVFGGNSMVYFGFTASTGGAFNLQYIIPNSAAVDGTKTAVPSVFLRSDPDKEVTYTIEVVNNGVVTAFGTQITDTLPLGFSYIPGTTTGATTQDPVIDTVSVPGREVLYWNLSAIPIVPGGGTTTISFDTELLDTVGTFTNDFTVSGDNFTPIDRSVTAAVAVGPADLSIQKNHTGNYTVGTNGTFTLDVANSGPDTAENIVITDILPAGLSYVSHTGSGWTVDTSAAPTIAWTHAGPLTSGSSLPTLTVTVLVGGGVAYPTVTNTASVTSDAPDLVPANDSDSDTITINPFVDLVIDKSHTGNFTNGVNGQYTLTITNGGSIGVQASDTVTVTDTLPAGLTYVNSSGTGWTVDAAALPTVTWTHAGPLASGASLPDITLTVLPDAAAVPSVTNSASVSCTVSDADLTNNSDSDITIVTTDVDLGIQKNHIGTFTEGVNGSYDILVSNNGPGDETNTVTVTDVLPSGLTYVSSSGTGWTVDTSALPTVTWTHAGPLPAGTSLPVLTLTVLPGSAAVPIVTNTASVSTPSNDTDPANDAASDPTTVIGPGAANKPLYVYDGSTLSRTPPSGTPAMITINGNGGINSWTLAPALTSDLTISSGNHPVRLWINRNNSGSSRTVTVALTSIGTTTGSIGAPVTQTFDPGSGGPIEIVFNINLASSLSLSAGSQIVMTVTNSTPPNNWRRINVYPVSSGNSLIGMTAETVIAITNLDVYDAAYAGGSVPAQFLPGDTVYVRGVVSDPFGSDDINTAFIDIIDPNGIPQISGAAAPLMATDTVSGTKTFEYSYVTPLSPYGVWTARLRVNEGTESLVSDVRITTFTTMPAMPDLIVLKTTQVISDPVNGSTNPKAIPGAFVQYTVRITNQGSGTVDTDTSVLTDAVNANTELSVSDFDGLNPGPVRFNDGTPASGLTYSFVNLSDLSDDINFSNDNGATFTYVPVPDANGCDANVTHIRVNPKGQFNAAGGGNPYCDIHFKVRVK